MAAIAALGAGAVTACTLLTSLDGLSDGSGGGGGGPDTGTTPLDGAGPGGEGGKPIDDGGGGADGGVDAAPSASDLYAAAVLADNPVGYWRLEETAGTVAKDETRRNDGTFVNGPQLGEPGIAGSRAAKLPKDTNARMVVTTGDFGFTGNTPYTIELWARPAVFKDYQWLVATELETGGRHGWSLLADSAGALRYEAWKPADGGDVQTRGLFVTSTPIALDVFAHIVLAYTGSTAFGYVNGVQTTMFNTVGICPPAGPLLWGCRGDIIQCLDDWVIDELAIYDFALDGVRAKAHYDLGK